MNIKKLIKDRDESFMQVSAEIYKSLDTKISVINDFLVEVNEIKKDDTVFWEEISIQDELVTLHGIVHYKLGTEVIVDGMDVKITYDNIETLHGVVFMTVDIYILESTEESELIEYLYQLAADREDDIDNMFDATDASAEPSTAQASPSISMNDFDLGELTEEQLKALNQHNITDAKN